MPRKATKKVSKKVEPIDLTKKKRTVKKKAQVVDVEALTKQITE